MGRDVACVWDVAARLGEGPLFCRAENAVYFVDIEKPAILRYGIADGAQAEFAVPEKIGCLVPAATGGFVAGLQSGFARVRLPAAAGPAEVTPLLDPEPDRPGNRCNDGKVDAQGRLWAGTMDDAIEEPTGVLYRLDPDLSLHAMDDGYIVTNGPAFSPDGRTLYHNDSVGKTVFAFDLDPASGALANKRVFARTGPGEGVPDGLTVDAAGGVWLAHWGGWRVTHFDPAGAVVEVLTLPASQITSCAFGGPALETLFITSASTGLTPAQRAAEPLAGGLFAVDVGVAGALPNAFAG